MVVIDFFPMFIVGAGQCKRIKAQSNIKGHPGRLFEHQPVPNQTAITPGPRKVIYHCEICVKSL